MSNDFINGIRILLGGKENWTDGNSQRTYRAANDTNVYNTDMNPQFNDDLPDSKEKEDNNDGGPDFGAFINGLRDFFGGLKEIGNNVGTIVSAATGNPAIAAGNIAGRAAREASGFKTPGEQMFEGLANLFSDGQKTEEKTEEKIEEKAEEPKQEEPKAEEKEYDWEYEYKPGDTFGQVLLNLGASDGKNLWGPAGDVAYYTQQLRDQNMLDERGNVKLGKKFYLKKRPDGV